MINDLFSKMERESGLAVFEQIPAKKQSSAKSSKDFCDTRPLKRRKRGIYIDEDDLSFVCKCNGCDYNTNKYYNLLQHLTEHADETALNSELNCSWLNCDYVAGNLNYLRVHLTFHGYYSRLKILGACLLTKISLPECKEEEVKFATLPEFYTCEWDNCNIILFNYQFFLDHVRCHVNGLPKKGSEEEGAIQCGWAGCTNEYLIQYKVLDHVRSHTKEKSVACPTCGATFSCKTKFYDHRKRQLSTDLQGYQCSQCSKMFASERLLRDHMRVHINHYKCHLCDMTCTKPSTLAKHIRYRHLPERLFKCDICKHSTITHYDLVRHRETHSQEKRLECLSCGYKCRSKYTMDKHLKQHDGTWDLKYACHCCDKRFAMGTLLTKHLIKVHDFHWPSGHSRFSYKQNTESGLFYLQVVRYESLEVTQEMIQDINNIPFQLQNLEDCKFECVQNKPSSFVLRLSTKKSDDTQESSTKNVIKKEKAEKNE